MPSVADQLKAFDAQLTQLREQLSTAEMQIVLLRKILWHHGHREGMCTPLDRQLHPTEPVCKFCEAMKPLLEPNDGTST